MAFMMSVLDKPPTVGGLKSIPPVAGHTQIIAISSGDVAVRLTAEVAPDLAYPATSKLIAPNAISGRKRKLKKRKLKKRKLKKRGWAFLI